MRKDPFNITVPYFFYSKSTICKVGGEKNGYLAYRRIIKCVYVCIWSLLFIKEYRTSRHELKRSSRDMVNTQNVNDARKGVKERRSLVLH